MKSNLKISLIQSNLFWEDVNSNLDYFEKLILNISSTDIILLPEMFNTAFCPKSTHLAEYMNGKTVNWMKSISEQKNCAITGTLMVKEKGQIYNRLVWISKNGKIDTYDKRHLFSLIQEEKHITKGKKRLIVVEDGWKICPLICYDLRFPVFSRNNVDYDILIYLSNWPVMRIDAWDTLLKARAIENQAYTIGVNRIGEDGNNVCFNGHSKILDTFGKELLYSTENQEDVLEITLAAKDLKLIRKKINFLTDRDKFFIE